MRIYTTFSGVLCLTDQTSADALWYCMDGLSGLSGKKKKSILIVEEIQLWLAASWCISCARPRTVTKQPDHCCRHTRRDPWALSFSFPFLSFSLSLSLSHTHTHTHVRTAEEAPVWIISKCMLESLTCVWSAVSRVCMSNWVYFYCTCATVSADKITCKLDLS